MTADDMRGLNRRPLRMVRRDTKENAMSLFVVKHQHGAETCPAGDPQMGPMLLQHLSKPNAAQFGVDIRSEAVVDGQHTLYLVAEADAPETLEAFMAPFAQAGSVEVLAASPCEQVVARAAC